MAKLNAAARKKIKPSKFGLPGKNGKPGKYPEEDPVHAKDAEARASEELAKGKLSPQQAAQIRHKAHVVLGESDSHYHNK